MKKKDKSFFLNKGNRKQVLSWAFYDWANSAFATTVLAGFFPIFFKLYWNPNVDVTVSTARLGLANSIAGIFVALMAPILGVIADNYSAKKKFLFFFTYLAILMTVSLALISEGNWIFAAVLFIFANIGFSGGNIFYDSLITSVSKKENVDLVSSLGYSLGYLGGGVLFLVNVWMTLQPEFFGFENSSESIKVSFVTVGIWWALFSLPIFLFVKENLVSSDGSEKVNREQVLEQKRNPVFSGFSKLFSTFRKIKQYKTVFTFLIAYWFYIDGVDSIIRMAIDFGMSIGLDSNDLIVALLITQFIGFPSAIFFGYLGNIIGTKSGIYIALVVYLFVSIWGSMMDTKVEFFILASIIGLVQGGIQALSRSLYTRIIPKESPAEFFGFYNMLGKFATVIGPLLVGSVGLLIRNLGYGSEISSRIGMASISLLFIIGGIVFYFVKDEPLDNNL